MLTRDQVAIIKGLLLRGDKQQDIAALFCCNSGRIAEINTGQEWSDVDPAPGRQLPSPTLMRRGYAAFVAFQTLELIDLAVQAARQRILALHPDLERELTH